MQRRLLVSFATVAACLVPGWSAALPTPADAPDRDSAAAGRESTTPGTAPAGGNDTIVHLFEWNWASVARECTSVLGPKGYGGVQVSPPQEHVLLPDRGFPWWQDY
ncbi:MAG: hypothetical protein ACRCZD_17260, partial [Phycicoccus sp.]